MKNLLYLIPFIKRPRPVNFDLNFIVSTPSFVLNAQTANAVRRSKSL